MRVSADGSTTMTYGDDVALAYDLKDTRGFVNGDDASSLSGTPSWKVEGDVSSAGHPVAGEHPIGYDSGLTNALGYAIVTDTANTGTLTVDPLTLTATQIADGTSIYGDALAPGEATLDGVLSGDQVTAVAELANPTLSASGNVNVGIYDQQADTGNLDGVDAGNYTLDTVTQPDSYSVTPRPLTVTADDQRKTEGRNDPTLTYQTETMTPGRGLVDGDTLAGELERETGEALGDYAIQQGSVTGTNNPNYRVDFIGATLTIAAATPAPQPEPEPEPERARARAAA
ncbi:hypothetical protein HORIV_08490 [Vreelandella olivaria]|uniref:MBG domain-containing protein n=1 Tax=Vreelandella olivaria TaxID=390919 RepID=A0ABM7GD39_9GAMM|nr:hypothetical protein HORIV_08490 [Halomonas olivaria]